MSDSSLSSWKRRKKFWDRLPISKFKGNKPSVTPVPPEKSGALSLVPIASRYHKIPCRRAHVIKKSPGDESQLLRTLVFRAQVFTQGVYSPMQPGLPPVDDDPQKAIDAAVTPAHLALFRPPKRPSALNGPDLGALAVTGPYIGYLQAVDNGKFEWDLRSLSGYEHHDGLFNLGSRAFFEVDAEARKLRPTAIECELGKCQPGDANWNVATKIMLAALATHCSIVRHFCQVHLATGHVFSVVSRNELRHNHPILRLAWPHLYGTLSSDENVALGLLSKGGDFETIFSLRYEAMCRLFDDGYAAFDFVTKDPELDSARRGILNAGFDLPMLDHLLEYWKLVHSFMDRYVRTYYKSDADVSSDAQLAKWYDTLDRTVPNGISGVAPALTLDGVARLVSVLAYTVTMEHDYIGTTMWDYQLWPHDQPAQVWRDGGADRLDVFQRLVNYIYVLNVNRTALTADNSHLGVDEAGKKLFAQFRSDLLALHAKVAARRKEPWELGPGDLEANVAS